MENGMIYDKPIDKDFNKLSVEHKYVLSLIDKDSSVLEIGCHTGYFSFWLKEKDCSVFGADIYEPAIEKASKFLDESFIGNVETNAFFESIQNRQFDSIVIMHVLEHLVNPEVFLNGLREHLTKDGNIIIAVPNISNWNSRLELFKGNFNYTETGIMDKTHLRFFNYITMKGLIKKAGFMPIGFRGVGKSTFSVLPNWKVIWRINKVSSKVFQFLIRNNPNVLFHVLVFNIRKANR